MMKNSFFWRFLHENGMKPNPIHTAETHSSSGERARRGSVDRNKDPALVNMLSVGTRAAEAAEGAKRKL